MPTSCIAVGCFNSGYITGITYHKFPHKGEQRQKWIKAVNRKNWEPKKHSRICSAHFQEKHIDRTSLSCVRIREGAIPTIFRLSSFSKKIRKAHQKLDEIQCEALDAIVESNQVGDQGSEIFDPSDFVLVKLEPEVDDPVKAADGELDENHDAIAVSNQVRDQGSEIFDPCDFVQVKMELEGDDPVKAARDKSDERQIENLTVLDERQIENLTVLDERQIENLTVLAENSSHPGEKSCEMFDPCDFVQVKMEPEEDEIVKEVEQSECNLESVEATSEGEELNHKEDKNCPNSNIYSGKTLPSTKMKMGKQKNIVCGGKKQFHCSQCGKQFASNSHLTRHIGAIHSEQSKQFSCETCGRLFKQKDHLKSHMVRAHQDTRKFTCSFVSCSKEFKTKEDLVQHEKGVHKEKNILCGHCTKMFSTQEDLEVHVKYIHFGIGDFTCDLCEKSFPKKTALSIHIKNVHLKSKTFVCETCQKTFVAKSDLNKHVNCVHLKQKRFTCEFCHKSYGQSSALYKHQNLTHFKVA